MGMQSEMPRALGKRRKTAQPVTVRNLAIDLFCGLGGWTEGLLAEGYDVIGFDVERHEYGAHRYPAQLVLQDVQTLHGSQFRDAALIVASPPCQAYSYRAMPWSRAKALPPPDNALFDACFRIQREACEAAGRHVPMVVENVRGAQKWVGRARWNFGSFYLWGDVPALMPITLARPVMKAGIAHRSDGATNFHGYKAPGMNWSDPAKRGENIPHPHKHEGIKHHGSGAVWFDTGPASLSSKSPGRKADSAMIAKIPLVLSRHIAATYAR
jgi:hypothetical protein